MIFYFQYMNICMWIERVACLKEVIGKVRFTGVVFPSVYVFFYSCVESSACLTNVFGFAVVAM